ncbi:MAG: GAF domain-containing sensor histidine kinase [Chloroflexi bacterium]|nr:GAF domain-containing sensor histidine kinase [Chloroflexota bacterium]MCI0578576.1 GAF domain-containing sensor histidine kinase [Chloroflexota bacterium]MCI0647335.1 GAF domain-containing sensor histidine kinase [Chloroflexota bacterium]MCI0727795.1 GAF domain-containing sensor histidine kinase [Chloroflexota bacterium]
MNRESDLSTALRGRWLLLARAVWIAMAVVTLALFIASIPLVYNKLSTVSSGEGTSIWQLQPGEARALEQLGLSASLYALYWVVVQVVFVSGFAVVAGVIFRRKSDDWLALFVSLFLVMFGVNWVTAVPVPATILQELWYLAYKIVEDLVFISIPLFFLLFPDGQFVPRWTRPLAAGWIAFGLLKRWLPFVPPPGGDVVFLGFLGLGALAQIYRYRRVSGATQRQQTKWVVFGFVLTFGMFTGVQLLFAIFPWLGQPGAMLYRVPALTVILLTLLVLPLTIGMAVLRYRLWDIDLLLNRTLVYGTLSASVVGIYVLVVGFLGQLLQASGNLAITMLATGLVALLFQPLRHRLQRGVNRLMYGERDDPYAVLSRLGQRLEATLAPEAVLPTIVETVQESLKLPYVAITLKLAEADTFAVVTSAGSPVARPLTLPLVYQHETVGQLLLAPRAPGENFSPADLRLLDDLARQAGVAAHAVRLTTDLQRLTVDLQRSRQRLVTTREEERRRLRRDLHDGLGPTLASLAQRLDTARILVARDPDAAAALLGDLKVQVKATISDIRRLVYALRPPALDELGLLSAIREHAAPYNQSNGLGVSLEAPERLPPLPAAVEVAAYHIALEALTNASRHAHAQSCHIRLSLANGLCLEVTDDGDGLPTEYQSGVGLSSMRERAAELGGECRIEPGPARGTRVWAWLPLPPAEE